jgi:preprotein translocase subunit SecG
MIIGLILLQKHDSDGALGSGGGSNGMFSVRGQANLLTRTTAVLMTIFAINCLAMAKIAKRTTVKESVLERIAKKNVSKKEDAPPVKKQENSAPAPVNSKGNQNKAQKK